MHRTTCLLACLTLALLACGTEVNYIKTNPSPRPLQTRSADSVQVFTSGLPMRPYVEVGIITVEAKNELNELPEIMKAMRSRAAKEGCDGVIVTTATSKVVGNQQGVSTLKGREGACIVFAEPPAANEPIAPAETSAQQ